MPPQLYWILVYRLSDRHLTVRPFGPDVHTANIAYDQLEREYRDHDQFEVVLVGADSIETIEKTHSHYFVQSEDDLFEQFLSSTAT